MQYDVSYFGYGASAHLAVISALLGRNPTRRGLNQQLRGYRLVTQTLDQIPDRVLKNAPAPLSARSILQSVWTPDFRSYTIVPSKGAHVKGQIYMISEKERSLILEWELVPFGWMREFKEVTVHGGGIFYCTTEGLKAGQSYDRNFTVQNDFPPPLLADENRLLETAARVGEEFRSRR